MSAARPQREALERDVRRSEANLANMKKQLAEGTQRVRNENDRHLKSVLAASLLNLKKDIDDLESHLQALRLQLADDPPPAPARVESSRPPEQNLDADLSLALKISEEEAAAVQRRNRANYARVTGGKDPESLRADTRGDSDDEDEELKAAKAASLSVMERPLMARNRSPVAQAPRQVAEDDDADLRAAQLASLREAEHSQAGGAPAHNDDALLRAARAAVDGALNAESVEQKKAQLVSLLLAASERHDELERLQRIQPNAARRTLPVLAEPVAPERAYADARNVELAAARQLREEQEKSYAESLAKDQAKEREAELGRKAEQEEAERRRIDEEEEERIARLIAMENQRDELARAARMSVLNSLLPPSSPALAVVHGRSLSPSATSPTAATAPAIASDAPHSPHSPLVSASITPVVPAAGGGGETTLIKLRLPNGTQSREYPLSSPLSAVCIFAEQQLLAAGYPLGTKPVLTAGFPPQPIAEENLHKTLRELNLKAATITVSVKTV